MAVNRKATMAKRALEMEQKDRVKEREARRLERKARAEERAASGQTGPEMGEPIAVEVNELPELPGTPPPGTGLDSDES